MSTQHCRIGRNPANDLVINDRAAEDFHAVIMLNQDNLIFIEDQNSRYGTLVNGERISKVQLFPGDEVQIGFSRIDWESRTSFQPSLNEIEVIPNLSVPIKRPSQNNSAIADTNSNTLLNQMKKGDASLSLANSLIENEVQMDRLENSIPQEVAVETSNKISETTISTNDYFIEIPKTSQTEETEDLNESASNKDNLISPNQSVHLPIKESINEEIDLNNEGNIENDSSENLSLELDQELHQVESPIVNDNQSNASSFESNNSVDSNTMSAPINLNDSKQEVTIIDSSKPNYPHKKSDLLRKESVQIFLAIALTCILLAAGWLIGQAS